MLSTGQSPAQSNQPATSDQPAARNTFSLRVVIVGAGRAGQALAQQLGAHWKVHFVELDRDAAADLLSEASVRPNWQLTVGDGTSRLVLERARVADATALVAATGDDETNFECARLAREALGVQRSLAIVHDGRHLARFDEAGIEVVSASSAVATLLHNRLDRAVRTAVSVGLGQGEIVELTVEPTSSAVGRELRSFEPGDWIVAAVYRREDLLIPHGDTVIQAGDRLLLVGRPAILPSIAELLRGGIPQFPLPYGREIVALLPEWASGEHLSEVRRLATACQVGAPGVITGFEEPRSEARGGARRWLGDDGEHERWAERLRHAFARPGIGCLAVPAERFGLWEFLGWKSTVVRQALDVGTCPVLITRGTFPYRRILIPVSLRSRVLPELRLAISLAKLLDASLTAVAVAPPEFVGGAVGLKGQERALRDAAALGQAQRLRVDTVRLSGNPIHEALRLARDYDLVVLTHRAHEGGWRPRLLGDVSAHIAQRCPCSALVLPVQPEAPDVWI